MGQGQDVRRRHGRGHRAKHGDRGLGGACRKGQELREMTRDLDLLKVDVDLIATVIRLRGASAPTGMHGDETADGAQEGEGHASGGS